MFGHHPYTNIDGLDPDIVTTEDVSILIENKSVVLWLLLECYTMYNLHTLDLSHKKLLQNQEKHHFIH